jgi:hypothetical protein
MFFTAKIARRRGALDASRTALFREDFSAVAIDVTGERSPYEEV